jgi:hypothetical protein
LLFYCLSANLYAATHGRLWGLIVKNWYFDHILANNDIQPTQADAATPVTKKDKQRQTGNPQGCLTHKG